jgi:hypothetical protein
MTFLAGTPALRSMDVVAVGAAHVVVRPQRLDHAARDGLLAVVEVDKAEHLAPVVHLGALVFKVAPQEHVFVEHQPLLRRDLSRGSLKLG